VALGDVLYVKCRILHLFLFPLSMILLHLLPHVIVHVCLSMFLIAFVLHRVRLNALLCVCCVIFFTECTKKQKMSTITQDFFPISC
jgi:hypothetical protein